MMRRILALLGILAAAGVCEVARAEGGPTRPAAATTRPAGEAPSIGRVRLDVARRRVSFDAEVCLREGVLEFFLCYGQTKAHESVLQTRAKPSHVHAALLLLGLTPGKPARWSGQDANARFLPPDGAGLKISLAWADKQGRPHTADVTDWLKGAADKKVTPPKRWIFVGSDILPDGRYWADAEGEVISLTNFASAVVDVPFESSHSNDLREFFADPRAIPPIGTKVSIILTPLPDAEKAPHARALLEIDHLGRLRIDNRPVTMEGLEDWGTRYVTRHEQGMVMIRAAGRALIHDVAAAKLQLRLGGVREFDYQWLSPIDGVLPRTPDEAGLAMKQWRHKFANPRDYINEPGQEAQRELDRIRLRLAEMDARRKLVERYAADLREALRKYKPTTRPADKAVGAAGQ
jgi:hypothetical protein